MSPGSEFIVRALIIGIGATAVLDLWSVLLKRLFGIPTIAASRTPNPAQARLRSLLNHSVFGVGLYTSAVLAAMLLPPAVA